MVGWRRICPSMKVLASILIWLVAVQAQQQYDDYDSYGGNDGYYGQGEDTLYQDYAAHQQVKAAGGTDGPGIFKLAGVGAVGWFLGGKVHSKRTLKKAHKKHVKEMKDLYSKYLTDIGKLQTHIAELEKIIKDSARQQLTEEFLQADYDNNRQVNRAEFERYKREYLVKHPEMAGQFPAFEEFDPDHNGMITLREHEKYYEDRGLL